jgi:hypothetical protein
MFSYLYTLSKTQTFYNILKIKGKICSNTKHWRTGTKGKYLVRTYLLMVSLQIHKIKLTRIQVFAQMVRYAWKPEILLLLHCFSIFTELLLHFAILYHRISYSWYIIIRNYFLLRTQKAKCLLWRSFLVPNIVNSTESIVKVKIILGIYNMKMIKRISYSLPVVQDSMKEQKDGRYQWYISGIKPHHIGAVIMTGKKSVHGMVMRKCQESIYRPVLVNVWKVLTGHF